MFESLSLSIILSHWPAIYDINASSDFDEEKCVDGWKKAKDKRKENTNVSDYSERETCSCAILSKPFIAYDQKSIEKQHFYLFLKSFEFDHHLPHIFSIPIFEVWFFPIVLSYFELSLGKEGERFCVWVVTIFFGFPT